MSHELTAFARAFFHGAVLVWVYDCLTIWRLARKSGRVAVDLRDLLFWIFAALYSFRYFYTVSSGSLRAYLFAGMFLGALAWKYSLSPIYVRFGTKVLKTIGRILNIPRNVLKKLRKRLKFKLEKCRIRLYRPLHPEIRRKGKEKRTERTVKRSRRTRQGFRRGKSMSNKKKSSRKRARRMRGREKKALFVMGLIVGSVGITLTVRGNALNQQIQQNSLKESALEQQLEDETRRTEEIQELEQYMQSDEYIEKIAREKLGLLKENEILFREQ